MSRSGVLRLSALVLVLVAAVLAVHLQLVPDSESLRQRVDLAGTSGWVIFVGGYALLSLVPAPKAVLTAVGGAAFGVAGGAGLSLAGALIGALAAYELGRLLGREAVDRLTRGRLSKVSATLRDRGLLAVMAVRLVPVLPFTAINYAAGPAGVRRKDYLIGSAVGMVPGSIAYAAVGAFGADPLGLGLALAALLALVLIGGIWGRRILARPASGAAEPEHAAAETRKPQAPEPQAPEPQAIGPGPEDER